MRSFASRAEPKKVPYINQSLVSDGSLVLSVDESLRRFASEWMPSLSESIASSHPEGGSIRVDRGTVPRPTHLGAPSLALGRVRAWVRDEQREAYLENTLSTVNASIDFDSGVACAGLNVAMDPPAIDVTSLLTITAGLLLARRGRTPVHAAAVVHPVTRAAWLLVGDSHAGKSTTTANLVRAGWSYLSDDYIVLMRGSGDEVIAEGWPDDFHLDEGWHAGEPTGVRGTLRETDLRPNARKEKATVAGILFPRVDAENPTSIADVSGAVALERIIRQSPWLIADASSAAGVLDLMRVAASTNTADIRLGLDTFANPALLGSIVRRYADQTP